MWCILVCHHHLTIILCCIAVWAQACGSEHKTSFVIIVHLWFIWHVLDGHEQITHRTGTECAMEDGYGAATRRRHQMQARAPRVLCGKDKMETCVSNRWPSTLSTRSAANTGELIPMKVTMEMKPSTDRTVRPVVQYLEQFFWARLS